MNINFTQKPFLKVLILLIVLSTILFIYERKNKKDILFNGVENIAIIESYNYVSYLDNQKSKQTISFHRIKINYEFNGNNFSKAIELSTQDFKNKIGHELKIGDTLKIKHSINNPKNMILE